jgi:hypothetical protein
MLSLTLRLTSTIQMAIGMQESEPYLANARKWKEVVDTLMAARDRITFLESQATEPDPPALVTEPSSFPELPTKLQRHGKDR